MTHSESHLFGSHVRLSFIHLSFTFVNFQSLIYLNHLPQLYLEILEKATR